MQTFTVEINGTELTIVRDDDGRFIIPENMRGIGSALKPACEPIVVARKPLSEGTVAANVLRWSTGALNIDAARIQGVSTRLGQSEVEWGPISGRPRILARTDGDGISFGASRGDGSEDRSSASGDGSDTPHQRGRDGQSSGESETIFGSGDAHNGKPLDARSDDRTAQVQKGRWPSNLIHDGSEEVLAGFPESDGQLAAVSGQEPSSKTNNVYGQFDGRPATLPRGDSGSAARFFYTAKADSDDRLGSRHPTVKPLDLMQYLVRLVTRKGGVTLDPFAGTGTTGEAAFREGMRAVLIEREAEYQDDIRRRIAMLWGGPEERARAAIKERLKDKPRDDGPLFA